MLVRHYVWCTEYLYTHLHPRETAKTITLFDVKVHPTHIQTFVLTPLGSFRSLKVEGQALVTRGPAMCPKLTFVLILCPVSRFGVQGVGLRDLAGDAFDFLRKSASMIQEVRHPSHASVNVLGIVEAHHCLCAWQHYPERAKVILIVNTPGWFSFLWKMIK